MSRVTLLQVVRFVSGGAVPFGARFEKPQIQEQLCTRGQSCAVCLAPDTMPIRRIRT